MYDKLTNDKSGISYVQLVHLTNIDETAPSDVIKHFISENKQ